MKKKQLIAAALALTISVVGCGNTAASNTETSSTEQAAATVDPTTETGSHDATEKENTIATDAKEAANADEGSTKELSGTYKLDGAKNVTYTFSDSKMTLTESGSYSMGDKSITMTYGQNPETEYEITETDAGFNLIHESNLLPLVYMEGTDGLTGSELFDGIYSMSDTGFIFSSDGTMKVVTSYDDLKVKKKTVTFAGQTYDYKIKDGKIIFSTNGTDVMTLVP